MIILILFAVFVHSLPKQVPSYKEFYFEQSVDHFDYQSLKTFQNRYLICEKYFNTSSKDSPIFFYAGNEGDIVGFYNNSGYMFELAEDFGALVVFIEHRYYGKSWPDPDYKYQSAEQALADFIQVLQYLKVDEYQLSDKSSIIVFGGSYGGMLAAWVRMKYPHFVDGALAASAPVLSFTDEVSPESYSQVLTDAFHWGGGDECVETIRNGFLTTDNLRKDLKFDVIEQYYHTCQHLVNSSQIDTLINVMVNALNGISYANYPEENSFLRPLPPWAVKVACDEMKKARTFDINPDPYHVLLQMKALASVYYNHSGTEKCFDLEWTFAPHISDKGWDYQACTQMIMPIGSNGKDDFLLPAKWDLEAYVAYCKETYPGVRVEPMWIGRNFHNEIVRGYSNIIFSNGKLDPWSSGGVFKENIDKSCRECYAIVIEDGGHHVDLRFSSDKDTPTITHARSEEKRIISEWIHEKKARK